MATPFSDPWLLQYSEEHLMHELSMLWETADALPRHKYGTTEYTALLESFASHLRNLIEFFFFKPSGDYVRAEHFFEDRADWSPSKTVETNRLHSRASNEVTHLTAHRVSGNPPEKNWSLTQGLKEIETIGKEFAAKASSKKLHPKVREFLNLLSNERILWIGDNVDHSNVAAESLVVMGAVNLSTSTKIVYSTLFDPKKP